MGIQFKQIDHLQSTFDSLSGTLQTQITTLSGSTEEIASGDFEFAGWKYFTGNVDFSGAQGILVDPNNIYTPNTVFAGAIKIGGTIATPRNSTTAPLGRFHVTGGQSYFDDQINVRNDAGITAAEGIFSDKVTISGVSVGTGVTYYSAGGGLRLDGDTFSTSGEGTFDTVTGNSGYFDFVRISDVPTGILQLHNLPDVSQTGDLPDTLASPASGTVFKSGNHLMVI